MKRCPKCATDYFDDMLEFCLEDGTKLFSVSRVEDDAPTITKQNKQNPSTKKTYNLPFTGETKTVEIQSKNDDPITFQSNSSDKTNVSANLKILEILPVVIVLAHNWWQWLYVGNQYISSIPNFLISANFLIWILLLTIGAAASLLALKQCQNKGYAVTSLVILSVNLILFLVPKR